MRGNIAVKITIILLLFSLFLYFYLPRYASYSTLKDEELSLDKKIKFLEDENKKLKEEIGRINSDVKYMEKLLREKMGLVKPGEVVYKIVEEDER